tara:strand:+ start:7687 stop:7836 length:150 start_codon:yes stop_codon:yes gene_type:complete
MIRWPFIEDAIEDAYLVFGISKKSKPLGLPFLFLRPHAAFLGKPPLMSI